MKILIVDDEYIFRRFSKEILSKYGDCDTVVNGKEALEAFEESHKNKTPYDLITMDIMMPEFTGIETLNAIRSWEKKHEIPGDKKVKVVMITGSQDKVDFLNAFQEGCEAYILKPYDVDKFIETIRGLGFAMENNRT